MPPTPSADTISYGPRRSPGASRICRSGADYSRGAASDLPRPIQSSRIRLGCTAAIQLEARNCWLWPRSAGGFTRASCSVIIHDSSFAEVAERQTHQLEGLAWATPWRFESSLPHQQLTGINAARYRAPSKVARVLVRCQYAVVPHRCAMPKFDVESSARVSPSCGDVEGT